MTRPVLIIGNLTVDDVVQADGTTRMGRPGGNAVYAATAARLWSDTVRVVARRGEDLPTGGADTLERIGVATAFREIPGPTVRNWVIYEADGRRRWLYRTPPARAAEVAVRPGDIPPEWLAGDPAPVVHLAAMPLGAAAALLGHIRSLAPGALITVDSHEGWTDPEAVLELARQADVFVPSREELAQLVGYDDPDRGSKVLRAQGVPAAVVKLGDEGALVDSAGGRERLAAFPAEPVDPTGAGDSFCGALAAGLAEGLSLPDAARRGAMTAAWSVGRSGSLALAEFDLQPARNGDSYDIDVMRREIAMIPEVIARHLADPAGHVQRIADLLTARKIEHLFLVGCGDSHFTGLATALAFQRHTDIAAHAVHALDFARYQVRYAPPRSAVICVSFSGKVGRTTQAAIQAAKFGHLAVALTNDRESKLAQAADVVLPIEVPTLGFSPGTSTYLGMVSTLDDPALRWAAARGLPVDAATAMLDAVPALAAETLAANGGPSEQTARLLAEQRWITFLGAGPNEASSRFGAAKLFEGPQLLGVSTNIEEWA